ncbi:MAG: hypothetical protein IJ112_09155, partial [Oscillospiraceae bacterium]|nr:hypothetical protein [Oscillospiraceae bacterium]
MQKTNKLYKWLVLPLLVLFVATLLVCSLPTTAHAENGFAHLYIYTNGRLDNTSYTVVPAGYEGGAWNIPMGVPVTVTANDGSGRTWSLNGAYWEAGAVAAGANSATIVKDAFSGTHNVVLRATTDGSVNAYDPGGSGNSGSGSSGSGNSGSGLPGSGNSGSGNSASGNSGSGNSASGNSGSGNSGSAGIAQDILGLLNPSGSGWGGSGNSGSGLPGSGNSGSGLPGSGNSGSGLPGSGNSGSGLPGSGNSGSGLPGSGNSGSGLPGS